MVKDRLYRLMDIVDEIKKIDQQLSKHAELGNEETNLLSNQYKARKEQLLVYFINELNASNIYQASRLGIIKQIMERFYQSSDKDVLFQSKDEDLYQLTRAISA